MNEGRREGGKEGRKEGMCEWGYWMQMIDDVVAHVTMCGGEGKRSWVEVRWTKMRKVKYTWVEKNVRKWSNSLLLLLLLLCSTCFKTACGYECFQWLSCYSIRGSPLSKAEDESYEDATVRRPPAIHSSGSISPWELCQHRWLGGGGQRTIAR